MQVSTSTIASWINKNEHEFLFEWNIYVSGQVLVLEGNKTIIKDEWKRTVTRGGRCLDKQVKRGAIGDTWD